MAFSVIPVFGRSPTEPCCGRSPTEPPGVTEGLLFLNVYVLQHS
jgi:hypothetical protein